jgi:uncharacterized protein (TIGR00730 family)
MKSLAVFCGSSNGYAPLYVRHARELGRALALRDITLVYGGGCIGLMGQLADAALLAGGKVVGVIPKSLLEREVAHLSLTELIVTETMHESQSWQTVPKDLLLCPEDLERLTNCLKFSPGHSWGFTSDQ